jgi:hypothetical protein
MLFRENPLGDACVAPSPDSHLPDGPNRVMQVYLAPVHGKPCYKKFTSLIAPWYQDLSGMVLEVVHPKN